MSRYWLIEVENVPISLRKAAWSLGLRHREKGLWDLASFDTKPFVAALCRELKHNGLTGKARLVPEDCFEGRPARERAVVARRALKQRQKVDEAAEASVNTLERRWALATADRHMREAEGMIDPGARFSHGSAGSTNYRQPTFRSRRRRK